MDRPVIVHVVQHLQRGGIESYALALAGAARDRLRTRLVSLEGDGAGFPALFAEHVALAPQIAWFGKAPGLQPGLVLALARHFRELRPTTVVTHHLGPLLYAGLAARLARVPGLVHTVHDLWHLDDRASLALERTAIQRLRPVVVAQAMQGARHLAAVFPGASIACLPSGIDLARFVPRATDDSRRALGIDWTGPIIGCAARLVPEKGLDLLIAALALLPAPIRLVIAGEGPERERLQGIVAAAGLSGRVRFLGAVADMPHFYAALDLFVLPSRCEGLPLSLLEAQACGRPALATRVGMVEEAVCPATGVIVAAGDARALADGIAARLPRGRGNPRAFLAGRDLDAVALRYAALAGPPDPSEPAGPQPSDGDGPALVASVFPYALPHF